MGSSRSIAKRGEMFLWMSVGKGEGRGWLCWGKGKGNKRERERTEARGEDM